jgi:predicted nucleic acid-binding protein
MVMAIICDTGALYALADADDQFHPVVMAFVERTDETLIVPSAVVPEICYLLLEYLGPSAELRFLRSLTNQELLLDHFTDKDLHRVTEILEQYQDAAFGFVDAMVMATAERLRISTVLTTDLRDFSIFRPKHAASFRLVPEVASVRRRK